MYRCFLFQRIPPKWASAYPSLKSLGSWFKDLLLRIDFLRSWVMNGPPSVFWISAFSFPQGFLTAVLQQHARRFKIPIDTLRFRCEVQQQYNSDEIKQPARLGVYISGLFMEGARWDAAAGSIAESRPAELFTPMPVILLEPEDVKTPKSADTYAAPCYKTITRYGALSTTGLSTNFVLSVDLPTRVPAAQWILRGCALVCALAE
jgi:dynein heavy chain